MLAQSVTYATEGDCDKAADLFTEEVRQAHAQAWAQGVREEAQGASGMVKNKWSPGERCYAAVLPLRDLLVH